MFIFNVLICSVIKGIKVMGRCFVNCFDDCIYFRELV